VKRTIDTTGVDAENVEAAEAWSGPLFETFLRYRSLVAEGAGAHGEAAIAGDPPARGAHVIDLGCGFGETTRRLAELVGAEGLAVGTDFSPPFIEVARREAAADGVTNVEFRVDDVQTADLGGPFDYAFSRMGIMFFADPVAALRNVRSALRPGGLLTAVVWRRKPDNEWAHRAEKVVEKYLEPADPAGDPTPGPGPFSMADADVVSEQLKLAGFEAITLRRCDLPVKLGHDLDAAVEFNLALGPAAAALRGREDPADDLRLTIAAEIRSAIADFDGPDGVWAPASTWIIGARNTG